MRVEEVKNNMIIFLKDRKTITDSRFIVQMGIKDEGKTASIMAKYTDEARDSGARCLATYDDKIKASYVLEMLFLAIRDKENGFEFPSDDKINELMELSRSGQCQIHFKTKANRHGGS